MIDVGAAVAGDLAAVAADITTVRAAIPAAVLKVIVESSALLSLAGERTLAAVCRAAEESGADFVKTSTGFHPTGGASVAAVELMAATVGGRLGVKASGGIRTAPDALAMLAAGATDWGCPGRGPFSTDWSSNAAESAVTATILRTGSSFRAESPPSSADSKRLDAGEAGILLAVGDRRVAGHELGGDAGIGDRDAVGVNSHRQVLGQCGGERVQGRLDLSRGRLKPSPVRLTTCRLRPPLDTSGLAVTVPRPP